MGGFGKKGVFPIGAFVGPVNRDSGSDIDAVTDAVYADIKRCGITFIDSISISLDSQKETFLRQMELAEKYGIDLYVADNEIWTKGEFDEERMAKSVGRYLRFPAFCGVFGKDEPTAATRDEAARRQKAFKRHFPDKDFRLNFLPSYGTPQMWGVERKSEDGKDYERYVEAAYETFDLDYFSYDYYPFVTKFPYCIPEYFENLELVARKAKEHGVPFHFFVQATSWNPAWARYVTEGEMDFLIRSSLAYGAKGICYFTYGVPVGELPTGEKYSQAMIDLAGNRTERWYFAKKNNDHIKACEKDLLAAEWQGVMAAGTSVAPLPKKSLLSSFRSVTGLEGAHVLMGCFDCEGKTMLYLMNNSIEEPTDAKIAFDRPVRIESVGDGMTARAEGRSFGFSFGPGNGCLVRVSE